MGGKIALPEVVEIEVNKTFSDISEEALVRLKKDSRFLANTSRRTIAISIPRDFSIADGLAARWDELSTVIQRFPITYKQLRVALDRVMTRRLPSGANNEQFRDSCIWEVFSSINKNKEIYLVSNDSAFYQDKNRRNGIAATLKREILDNSYASDLYPDLESFLEAKGYSTKIDYPSTMGRQLAEATRFALRSDLRREELQQSDIIFTSIRSYTTVKRSQVAITFSARAWLLRDDGSFPKRRTAYFVEGNALYDTKSNEVLHTLLRHIVIRYIRPYEPDDLLEISSESSDRDHQFTARPLLDLLPDDGE